MIKTYLEVDDDEDDKHSCEQVGNIGRVLPVKGLLQGEELVGLRQQEVEQGDDGSLELGSLLRADRDGRERLPQDDLADVGGDEE